MLHRWNWSESSLILDLYTRERGRLVVAAKGAKRPGSQLRSVLLPFQRLLVVLGGPARRPDDVGAGPDAAQPEVQALRTAEWAGGPSMPTGAALFSGLYLNELLMRLTARDDAAPALFDVYADTLTALRSPDDAQVQAALRAFELLLLRSAGLLPDLSLSTVTQAPVNAAGRYRLEPTNGVLATSGDDGPSLSGEALVAAEAALRHGSVAAVQQACGAALPPWRAALRGLLYHHLGLPLLRTRQVLRDVQALTGS